MKKLLYFIFCLLAFACRVDAQSDTIYLKDGSRILAKISEVGSSQIKYKRADNSEGPTYYVMTHEVKVVVYSNGRKETFSDSENPAAVAGNQGQQSRSNANQVLLDMGRKINYNGPRIGASYFSEGQAADDINKLGKQPVVTQFGWQFETRVFTSRTGMVGLAEFLPMLGGMEQGMLLPSAAAMFALRSRNGMELSAGPTVSKYGLALIAAVSTSFRIDDVYFPVTLSFVPNVHKVVTESTYSGKKVAVETNTGYRISLTIGFNTARN